MNAKEKLLRIVENAKGDDLERAESFCKNCTPEQMKYKFGNSGITNQEMLERYRKEREEWQEAYDLLKEMIKKDDLWDL